MIDLDSFSKILLVFSLAMYYSNSIELWHKGAQEQIKRRTYNSLTSCLKILSIVSLPLVMIGLGKLLF
jgi:hypothetical protein